ncbi:RloB family protein [Candidatus Woesearchaeota archaeon]|nr:RloB family protein [Candidatus Woesearchaeota archaeon]
MEKGYRDRKKGTRKEYRVFVIVCEGEKTERIYFNRYRKRGCGLIIKTPNTRATDPVGLVEFAKSQIGRFGLDLDNGDGIWCVFDADGNTNEQIGKAIRSAGNKVNIILSNPSFEV